MIPCLLDTAAKYFECYASANKNPHQLLLERVTYCPLALANLFCARKLIIKSARLRQNSTVHSEPCQGITVYLPINVRRSARAADLD